MKRSMMLSLILISTSTVTSSLLAEQIEKPVDKLDKRVNCDCTTYPFKPNPPCYGRCVAVLAKHPNPNLSNVRGLDPGVEVGIHVLSANPKDDVDFQNIRGKQDLERAAARAIQGNDVKLEAAAP